MRNGFAREVMQRIAIRTQFPPMVWVYRAVYEGAIWLCVRRLKKVKGVRSIYLRRGLASGRALYGLSDIDLMVMVEEDPTGRTEAAVRYHYALLRQRVPMLAEGELALYTAEQFRTLFRYSPFYRYRFEQGRERWRRLFGEDVFGGIPSAESDLRSLATQELLPAWRHLSQEFCPGDRRPAYLRRYVAYKAVAEAARAAMISAGAEPRLLREEAIMRVGEVFCGLGDTLAEVQRWSRALDGAEPIPMEDVVRLFRRLAEHAFSAADPGISARRRLHIRAVSKQDVEVLISKGAVAELEAACAAAEEVERAVLVPRLSFAPVGEMGMDPVALAGTTIDAFDLVLVGREFPPIAGLRKLNGRLERFRPVVNAFYADGELVWALHPIEGWTVRSARDAPELFAALSCTGRLRGKLEVAEAVEVERGFPELDTLRRRAVSLLAMFRERAVFRMPMRAFCTVFWEAGRATLMAHSKKDDTIEVPVSSEQVVDRLAQLTPDCAPALRQIHQEYVKEAQGRTSEAHRYTGWAAGYARKLEQVLCAPNEARADSLGPARTELTISVLIVTRNRAGLLRRALESLTGQQRQAEEVVVVDNASTDNTAATVQAFAARLPLKFVRENKIGIPFARNTGLQNCTQDIVALMDDDCVADPAWLREMEIPFLKDPYVGAVGGSVLPIEGQPELVSRFYESRMNPLSMEEGTDVS